MTFLYVALPSAILSSQVSSCAVKSTLTIPAKYFFKRSVTLNPISVGTNCFPSFSTYLRLWMVSKIGAYVDGRPMPFSSSVLIRLASVYLGGGAVKCCSPSAFVLSTVCPLWSAGRRGSSSLSCFFSFTVRSTVNPSNNTCVPVARSV